LHIECGSGGVPLQNRDCYRETRRFNYLVREAKRIYMKDFLTLIYHQNSCGEILMSWVRITDDNTIFSPDQLIQLYQKCSGFYQILFKLEHAVRLCQWIFFGIPTGYSGRDAGFSTWPSLIFIVHK
jgi:hypothetical protein